jgi:NAD(P)-dependent dehydrogenase (short-subunit alcohol dehydrogenase family)
VRSSRRAGLARWRQPLNSKWAEPSETHGGQLGRIGRAEEFANIACFLASDDASHISGTAINVDGGRSPVV